MTSYHIPRFDSSAGPQPDSPGRARGLHSQSPVKFAVQALNTSRGWRRRNERVIGHTTARQGRGRRHLSQVVGGLVCWKQGSLVCLLCMGSLSPYKMSTSILH
jgi:hypothetical protein